MQHYLLISIDMAPRVLAAMYEMTPPDLIDQKTDPSRFTLREAIAHLADWEPILRGRMETGVKDSGASVLGMDESIRAEQQGYERWDPERSLELWAKERAITAQFLRSLPEDAWDKHVVHSERGKLTVYDLANELVCHDMYHLDHAAQFLKRPVGTVI